MFYAVNKNGIKVDAYDANKGEEYICPVCNGAVVLKQGTINIPHFAHEANSCDDHWNYDMSEWHKRMQGYFPKESREVVVNYKGEKHRADVLINDIVLEFQYSSITAAEFQERNEFFKKAGYRLAWVFNLGEIVGENLNISRDRDDMWIWKNPMRIFSNMDYIGEENKRFALWFYLHDEINFAEMGYDYIERVIWAPRNDDHYSMTRFITAKNTAIIMDEQETINPNHFFRSRKDIFKDKLSELKSKYQYSVKYRGKKGEDRQSYICPRRPDVFGINMWGETGCYYCKYCYMVANKENKNGKMYASYCCYPKQVRELEVTHPGYECNSVDDFDI